ncbi:hypothetical protein C8Q75DRAFT_269474 [Abortiporus biennis]|nr:hypothetical protein C8Q75DRAFT_269474 [Abortiporus biennis]
MTALPSFVELMASLGLNNESDNSRPRSQHSRSSSYSSTSSALSRSSSNVPSQPQPSPSLNGSPAIIISQQRTTSLPTEWDSERRRHRSRYSPYSSPISHVRRGSMPSFPHEEQRKEQPSRALSSSPCPSMPVRTVERRSSALGLSSRRPEKLALMDSDLVANMPISSFVRRKTPQSSPISPTFPHRAKKRSVNSPHPVTLPTLPSFIFPHQPIESTPLAGTTSSDTEDEDMTTPNATYHLETHSENLSLRKLRLSRRSESSISLRRSPDFESHSQNCIPPLPVS